MTDTDAKEEENQEEEKPKRRRKSSQPEATKKAEISVEESEENFLNIQDTLDPEVILKCKIHGKWYDYARRDLWSLKTRAKWSKYWKRVETIENLVNEGGTFQDDDQIEVYEDALAQMVKLALPKYPTELVRDLPAEAQMAIIVDFLVRTTPQSASFKMMEGLGKKDQMMQALEQIVLSNGEGLFQNSTGNGLEGGTIG